MKFAQISLINILEEYVDTDLCMVLFEEKNKL